MGSIMLYNIKMYPEIGYDEIFIFFFLVLIFFSNMICSFDYFTEFTKLLMKFDITLEKYKNIINNLKSSLIMIDITNRKIQVNESFLYLIKSLPIEIPDLEKLFICYDKKYEDLYKEEYKQLSIKRDFKKFITIFSLQKLQNDQALIKDIIFLVKLYYLDSIFNNFEKKNGVKNEYCQENKKKLSMKRLLISKLFAESEQFKRLGNFHLDENLSKEPFAFEFLFRKSKISDDELLDIIINDTTEIFKTEEEKAENKYRKQYLSNVAHEFKAPIEVLMLTVREISKSKIGKGVDMEKFEDIDNLSNYILILIMDIISFSKEERGVEVKFDIFERQKPFNFGLKVLKLLIKNNNNKRYSVKADLIIDDNVPDIIKCDETRLRQLIINFISNAFKFTTAGSVTIRVSLVDSTNLYDEIKVTIEDTGQGILPENRTKIFQRFGKLYDHNKVNYQGTGLGLSICCNLVDRIGNKIGYEPGKICGSIFSFTFYNVKDDSICEQIVNNKDYSMNKAIKITIINLANKIEDDQFEQKLVLIPQPRYNSLKNIFNKFENVNGIKVKTQILSMNDQVMDRINKLLDDNENEFNLERTERQERQKKRKSKSSAKLTCKNYINKIVNETKIKSSIRDIINDRNTRSNKFPTIKSLHLVTKNNIKKSTKNLISELNNYKELIVENFKSYNSSNSNFSENDNYLFKDENKKSDSRRYYPSDINTVNTNSHTQIVSNNEDFLMDIPSEAYRYFTNTPSSPETKPNILTNIRNKIDFPSRTQKVYMPTLHEKDDERLTLLYEMYTESLKFAQIPDFHAIFNNFINYFEFFLFYIRSINEKNLYTICIVDDSDIVLKSFNKMILEISKAKKLKVNVLKAFDGTEALGLFKIDYLLRRSFKYIFSDQNMTLMNGIDTLKMIHKFSLENPLQLYICSSDDFLIKSQNLEFLKFLSKPVAKPELSKIIS